MLAGIEGWPGEVHRYFPEWAARPPLRDGVLHEADRNSYLAGGYAEEFGYDRQPDQPADLAHLDGEPERSEEWRMQLGALHPGYPERARPLDWELYRLFESAFRPTNPSVPRARPAVEFRVIRMTGLKARSAARPVLRWKAFLIRRRAMGRPM